MIERTRTEHHFMFWLCRMDRSPLSYVRVERYHDWMAGLITDNPARAKMLRWFLMGRWGMGCGETFKTYCSL